MWFRQLFRFQMAVLCFDTDGWTAVMGRRLHHLTTSYIPLDRHLWGFVVLLAAINQLGLEPILVIGIATKPVYKVIYTVVS